MTTKKAAEKAELAQPRETGSQKAKADCPECGGKVPVVVSEYGSVAPGACPKCWPKADKASQLEAQEAAAELAAQ
jgi:ssDNA-binding Zn-finger/Zn-ribbon topoisomerase 1